MQRVAVAGSRLVPATARRLSPAILLTLAIALAIVALARPRWGEDTQVSFSQTREVMIALDLSRSMWAEDVEPSRIELARKTTEDLLNGLKGESVGLIVFAGTAFVQVPLSPDYQIIREFMPSLDPDYMPQGGSDYQKMLEAALEGFGESNDRDRYLIVLSDGESSTPNWQNRLAELTKRDIHVVGLGIGTDKGGFINDQKGGYLADKNGDAVLSRLQPATLQTLANRTNGKYVNASALKTPDDVRALIKETVETGRQGRVNNESTNTQIERFQWFLVPAVLLGLASLVREFERRARPQPVRKTAIAVLVALSVAPAVRAHFDGQAGFVVKEVFDSSPSERLRAIADHLGKYGYDAFDLQLMVEATIKYGIDESEPGIRPWRGLSTTRSKHRGVGSNSTPSARRGRTTVHNSRRCSPRTRVMPPTASAQRIPRKRTTRKTTGPWSSARTPNTAARTRMARARRPREIQPWETCRRMTMSFHPTGITSRSRRHRCATRPSPTPAATMTAPRIPSWPSPKRTLRKS